MTSPRDARRLRPLAELEALRDAIDAPIAGYRLFALFGLVAGAYCVAGIGTGRHHHGPRIETSPTATLVGLTLMAVAALALGVGIPRWRERRARELGAVCPDCDAPLLRSPRLRDNDGEAYQTRYGNVRAVTPIERYRMTAFCRGCAARVVSDPPPNGWDYTLDDPGVRGESLLVAPVPAQMVLLVALLAACVVAAVWFGHTNGARGELQASIVMAAATVVVLITALRRAPRHG